MNDIIVQPLVDLAALHEVEVLQRAIWGMPPEGIVPAHQLLAATSAGGVVLGARTSSDGLLVGFSYGFVGQREGRLLFYSHMTGVHRDFRGAAIGFRLKCAQRDFVLAQGIDRIVWTYDPLLAANSYFNLHKLGAVAQRYYVNYYGEMDDELNRRLPSDRLEVDWWLRTLRVERAIGGNRQEHRWEDSVPVLTAHLLGRVLAPELPRFEVDAPVLRIEIPTAGGALKTDDADLAPRWRAATREIFLHYFTRGYRAVDFLHAPSSDRPLGGYLLMQTAEEQR
jgi:predicted GNAT superfamily acetyltransferase